jgi:hypothetical protein
VIILKAMAKEPQRRYQSAAELGHDVQCWLDGLPLVARSASSAYLIRRLVSRHRYASTVAGLVLLILVASSWISTHFYLGARAALRVAEGRTRDLSAKVAENLSFSQLEVFNHVLSAFQEGLRQGAATMPSRRGAYPIRAYMLLEPTSREGLAARFLLDPRPLEEKLPEFRKQMLGKGTAFTDYVIAEHQLRDGDKPQALDGYRRARLALPQEPDMVQLWLKLRVSQRIEELAPPATPVASSVTEAHLP